MQKAVNKNRLRSDSASEEVRADESIAKERTGTRVKLEIESDLRRLDASRYRAYQPNEDCKTNAANTFEHLNLSNLTEE